MAAAIEAIVEADARRQSKAVARGGVRWRGWWCPEAAVRDGNLALKSWPLCAQRGHPAADGYRLN
jgi:hypothetical protein